MRRRPSGGENIFAKEVMDKGLTSKTEERLVELNIKNNKIKTWLEDLRRPR